MISNEAKANFLNRNLSDYDWLKTLSEAELDKRIASLPIQLDYKFPLRKQQKIGFLIGAKKPSFLYFYDMGLGKTALVLALLRYHRKLGRIKKTLILVPKNTHMYSWEDEIKLHAPDLKYCVLDASTIGRQGLIDNSDADLYILNYPGLVYLGTTYVPKTAKMKGHQALDPDKLEWLSGHFDSMVCDESQYVSNHSSLSFKVANAIADTCKFRYGLTGTPFGKDPQKLWGQFKIIDRGETLGKILGMFRECFFKTKKNYWGGFEYKLDPRRKEDLYKTIKNRSLWYSADECLTLPPKVPLKKYVSFPEEIEAYYKKVIEEIKAAKRDYKLAENAFIRMRMLSSAFIGYKDEAGEKVKLAFDDNPKLEAVMDIIDESPADSKIIIFNEFVYSGDLICAALKKAKIKHSRLYSGTKNAKEEIRRFKEDDDYRILVCNSQSGGEGLNLQVANRVIFYELPTSPIIFQQAHKRVDRDGQKKTVFYYYLLMKKTFDERMLQSLHDGKELLLDLMEGELHD